ncbi:nucleotide exchange factor Fes1-domain-containing protein [Phyllosticta citrichinensis]|uniref:Nucleotide exchange factor Fes1-domain-containing protein n=1 Tax=Phyllosticta citrichinensis TaxID=1130410 RepID=A0ABR1XMB2_9PEZI
MSDPRLQNLLRWGIENSEATRATTHPADSTAATTTSNDSTQPTNAQPRTQLTPEVLAALLGGPSDADLMRESMTALHSPETDLAAKLTAFDNFHDLIEQIDNANNITPLQLWDPLLQLLAADEPQLRAGAAASVGAAVENNVKGQQTVFDKGVLPTLVGLAREDADEGVRKKAIGALSKGVRNFQPALDQVVETLGDERWVGRGLKAGEMSDCDLVIDSLREQSKQKAQNGA